MYHCSNYLTDKIECLDSCSDLMSRATPKYAFVCCICTRLGIINISLLLFYQSPTQDSVFASDDSFLDDVFFETPTPTGSLATPGFMPRRHPSPAPPTPADSLPPIAEASPFPSQEKEKVSPPPETDYPDSHPWTRDGRGSEGFAIPVTVETDVPEPSR